MSSDTLLDAADKPWHLQSVTQLGAALAAGETTATALAEHFLARIEQLNPALNCVVTTTHAHALKQAAACDARRARSVNLGPLDGIPILHKDLFCTQGVRTSCGSRMLDNFEAPYDATLVARAAQAGLVMLGKTNMDEFAMGSSNEHSHYGAVKNPWDTGRVPGGSSGGSAAAVAARLAPLASATDTGGSIRLPASFCGVTGIKPTYGRVSRYGMVAFASSLDQGGWMGASAADIAPALGAVAGLDPHDSTSADEPVPDFTLALNESLTDRKIGLAAEHFGPGLSSAVAERVNAARDALADAGASIHEISLERAELTVPTYYVIALAEASTNLSRFDGVRFGHRAPGVSDLDELYQRSRAEGFGDEVKRRIMLGTYALSAGYYDAYYGKAQQLRRLISQDFSRAFESVDMILAPTAPTTAFALGERTDDPVHMYLVDIYTCAVNLAGLPAISFPVGVDTNGMPIGAQLIGPHFSEARLLSAAHALQQSHDWHLAVPALVADGKEATP
jgi:aspartyl-tRNA(Asn)/glutamyl-tRNA(Gln) amidotransferase subunit A